MFSVASSDFCTTLSCHRDDKKNGVYNIEINSTKDTPGKELIWK
jgi:hypothetical protein